MRSGWLYQREALLCWPSLSCIAQDEKGVVTMVDLIKNWTDPCAGDLQLPSISTGAIVTTAIAEDLATAYKVGEKFWNSQQGIGVNFRWVALRERKICHRRVFCSNRLVTHLTARLIREENQTGDSHAMRVVNDCDRDNNIQGWMSERMVVCEPLSVFAGVQILYKPDAISSKLSYRLNHANTVARIDNKQRYPC